MRLCHCLRPAEVIYDNGSEFIGKEFQELLNKNGIKADDPTTAKNSRAQPIIERMHLTMGEILRIKIFEGHDWCFEIDYALQSLARAVQTLMPSMIPMFNIGTLAFWHDTTIPMKVQIDWEFIKKMK